MQFWQDKALFSSYGKLEGLYVCFASCLKKRLSVLTFTTTVSLSISFSATLCMAVAIGTSVSKLWGVFFIKGVILQTSIKFMRGHEESCVEMVDTCTYQLWTYVRSNSCRRTALSLFHYSFVCKEALRLYLEGIAVLFEGSSLCSNVY